MTHLRVAMALYGALDYDSRVLREARTLVDAGHAVTIYCLAGSAPPDGAFEVRVVTPTASKVVPDFSGTRGGARQGRIGRLVGLASWVVGYSRNLRSWGRQIYRMAGDVDIWHVHDLPGLFAVAPHVQAPLKLVYDSHELFLETGTAERLPSPIRRLLGRIEARLTRRASSMVTVNDLFAEYLDGQLRPSRIVVVRNCPVVPDSVDAAASPLRPSIGVSSDVPLFLYHGVLARTRGIDEAIAALGQPGLEDAHLALLGFGQLKRELEQQAADGPFAARLHVVDAVPSDELVSWVSGADVGLIPILPVTLSHRLTTPNKLWECLAAGVPVIASDLPGMHDVVLESDFGQLGFVCDPTEPSSIAAAMRSYLSLSPAERAAFTERCLQASRERWNWQAESGTLRALYEDLAVEAPV